MTKARGRFITFEGGEGAGKSTQIRLLRDALRAKGLAVTVTREPGGTPAAETIRDMLLAGTFSEIGAEAETLLFFVARLDHLDKVIRPALARGEWVLCDRFLDSTRAYQGGEEGVDAELIARLEEITIGETMPDLTIILDLPVEIGLARLAARPGTADRFEHRRRAGLERRRAAFLAIAANEPERCAVFDANRSERDVAEAIGKLVAARFPLGAD